MSEQSRNGDPKPRGGGFFSGFLAGAVVGAILVYIIVQEDARDLIVGKAREAGNFAKDASGDLRDLYNRGKDVVEGARSDANSGQQSPAEI